MNHPDKADVEDYLKASGLPNASVHTGAFAETTFKNLLHKTPAGYTFAIPKFNPSALQAVTWVSHDLGASVLAILKNYDVPGKEINGKAFPVVTAQISYSDMAERTSKGECFRLSPSM